jgi:NAD-dependent SIR2 family protein deacetylase
MGYLSGGRGSLRSDNLSFLLGAGASYDHGYPLVREFLSPKYLAWLFDQCNGILPFEPTINFAQADEFRKISENFEEVLSVTFDKGGIEYNTALDYAYYLLMMVSCGLTLEKYISTTAEYLGLAYFLVENAIAGKCSVITFNYDTTVEEALCSFAKATRMGRRGSVVPQAAPGLPFPKDAVLFNYGYESVIANILTANASNVSGAALPTTYPRGRVQMLKLHGSVTTLFCENCESIHYFPLDLTEAVSGVKECKVCSHGPLRRLMVPPGKRKKIPTALNQLWLKAEAELAASELIVIAGYSIPDYDLEARSLLQSALRNKDVLLVDPNPSANTIEFLRNSANSRPRIIRETTSAFLRKELNTIAPGFIKRFEQFCAIQYSYPEKMAGHLRS